MCRIRCRRELITEEGQFFAEMKGELIRGSLQRESSRMSQSAKAEWHSHGEYCREKLFFFHYSVREILMVEGLEKGYDDDSNLSLFLISYCLGFPFS